MVFFTHTRTHALPRKANFRLLEQFQNLAGSFAELLPRSPGGDAAARTSNAASQSPSSRRGPRTFPMEDAPEAPVGFHALSDDLVMRALLRAPFTTHGKLHAVCRRFKSLLRSDAFREQRLESGLAEHGVVVVGGVRDARATAGCYMLLNARWRPIAPITGHRTGACSVVIDNEMWVMGGVNDGRDLVATVEVYSPKTNSWRSCTPMSQRRYNAVAGVVGGRLVVTGGSGFVRNAAGRETMAALTSAEAFTGTEWTPLPPMPCTADGATACVLKGRLYVMGGSGSCKLQVLEMTEEDGLSWTRKADLPAPRHGAASVLHEGKIWVMGGRVDGERSTTVMTYDADADAWATAPPLLYPTRICRATSIDGCILLHQSPCTAPFSATPRGNDRCVTVYKDAAWSEMAVTGAGSGSGIAPCGTVLLG